MGDEIQRIKDDISFIRGVVKDDGSVLRASGIGLTVAGIIFGLSALRSFALARGLLHWPLTLRPLMSWDAIAVFFVILLPLLFLSGRPHRSDAVAISSTSRTVWASWAGVGFGYAVAAIGLSVSGSTASGTVLFAFWGSGWLVASAAYRRPSLLAVALGCYSVSIVSGLLQGTGYDALLVGCALLALVAGPGVFVLKHAKTTDR